MECIVVDKSTFRFPIHGTVCPSCGLVQGQGNLEKVKKELSRKGSKLDEQQRKKYKEDLDLVLKPFAGNRSAFDELGDFSEEGKTALAAALNLFTKHERYEKLNDEFKKTESTLSEEDRNQRLSELDSQKLTEAENKKLRYAYRAWAIYTKIADSVSSEYTQDGNSGSWRDYR